MQNPVDARPETTRDDIELNEQAADRFFASWDRSKSDLRRGNFARDLRNTIQLEALSGRLTACVADGAEWVTVRTHEHQQRLAEVAEVRRREDEQQAAAAERVKARISRHRPYVSKRMRAQMPHPMTHPAKAGDRRRRAADADRFFAAMDITLPADRRAAILAEPEFSFTLWVLLHPEYGPIYPAPEGYDGHNPALRPQLQRSVSERRRREERNRNLRPEQYKNGDIRPVGMTLERALEIATEILLRHG